MSDFLIISNSNAGAAAVGINQITVTGATFSTGGHTLPLGENQNSRPHCGFPAY